jgi:hypothetical protein
VDDLEQFSSAGCSFAKFILDRMKIGVNDPPGYSVIMRLPPDSYEDYPGSLIVGLPRHSRFAYLTLMVDEGE